MSALNLLLALLAASSSASPVPDRDGEQVAETAARHGAKESEVRYLRGRGFGWGEIARTLDTARLVHAPFYWVAHLREAGLSWEDIKESYEDELLARSRFQALSAASPEPLRDAVGEPKPPPRREEPTSDVRTLLDNRDPAEKRSKPLSMRRDPREARIDLSNP